MERLDELDSTAALETLVVLDLVDSTALIQELGDARAAVILARHDRMARDLLAKYGGREIDKTDGFLLLFGQPVRALAYTLRYHEQLARLSQELDLELRARAGIHFGEVFLRKNDPDDVARGAKPIEVEGIAKAIAARVMTLAQGGQTLLTDHAFRRASENLDDAGVPAEKLRCLSHGAYRLKGVNGANEIFEIGVKGTAPFSTPPDTPKVRRRNRWRTPMIAVLTALLAAAGTFLLGDRLARGDPRPSIAVLGFENLGRPDDGWLSTALTELLSTELAVGENLRLIPGENVARMKHELGLDENETLAAETLGRVRRHLGTRWVVVGSYLSVGQGDGRQLRLVLRLQETQGREAILSLSETGSEAELLDLVSRVGKQMRVKLGVGELSHGETQAVRAMVSRVPEATRLYSEGLAKLRGHDPMAARDLFVQALDADPRYAFGHAALSEAWLALGQDEAAEKSARQAYGLARDFPREAYLSIEGRYYEASALWEQAVETWTVLWGFFPDNVDYGIRLARAEIGVARHDDALATLAKLRRLPAPARDDPRIDLVEGEIYYLLAEPPKYLAAYARAVEKGRELGSASLVAEGRTFQGWGRLLTGELEEAGAAFDEARRVAAETGNRAKVAEALGGIAYLAEKKGDYRRSEALYREILSIHRALGNREHISWDLMNIAGLAQKEGDLALAHEVLEESIDTAHAAGSERREGVSLSQLARVRLDQGKLAAARAAAESSLGMLETAGDRWWVAWAHATLGDIHRAAGELAAARDAYRETLAICDEIEAPSPAASALLGQGEISLAEGDLAAAEVSFREAREIVSKPGDEGTLNEARLALARLRLELGQPAQAEALARQAARELVGGTDRRLTAGTVLARAILARGEVAAAREILDRLRPRTEDCQNPRIVLTFRLIDARVLAAEGQSPAALRELRAALAETESLGLPGPEFEIRLALDEIEGAVDPRRLRELATEADRRGFRLVARKAKALPPS